MKIISSETLDKLYEKISSYSYQTGNEESLRKATNYAKDNLDYDIDNFVYVPRRESKDFIYQLNAIKCTNGLDVLRAQKNLKNRINILSQFGVLSEQQKIELKDLLKKSFSKKDRLDLDFLSAERIRHSLSECLD